MSFPRRGLAAAALGLPFLAPAARAQARLRIAYTATSDWAACFSAREEGFFAARGLEVEMVLVSVSSAVPATLQSGSAQFGGTTPPSFLQAVDAGLDLIGVAGASVSAPGTQTAQVVVRAGSGISTPQGFEGRRVGTPGFGSVLDVLFRAWLAQAGVNLRRVTFVESAMPTQTEVLRGGTVDAVVSAEPFMGRMIREGIGQPIPFINEVVPPDSLMTLYVAARSFATRHPEQLGAFRAAIEEGARFVEAEPERARAQMGRYIRLRPDVLATLRITVQRPAISAAQVETWVALLERQGLIRRRPDPARLMAA
jgi:NitT/TauT family transport system substrate-binding protein